MRDDRLNEILRLIRAGYSRLETIALELKEDVPERMLRRDLQELKKRCLIDNFKYRYWVPMNGRVK